MGQTPPKYFLPQAPFGNSQAANTVNPVQPAAQNPQQPLLPASFGQQTPQNQQSSTLNPFYGLFALLILLFAVSAQATTTVSGTIQTLGTTNVTSAAFVRFWLRGCGGNQPRVNGTSVIGPTQGGVFYFDLTANSSGVISGTLYSTRDSTGLLGGDIECGGVKTSVWYGMQVFQNGKGGPEIPVHAKNGVTLDITQVTPISATPAATAPSGDATYARLDGGNQPFSAPIQTPGVNNIIFVDGVTYPTVQAAYTAAVSKGLYEVFIPDGTYTVALGSFTMSAPIRFQCESRKGTVINFTGASGIGVLANYATTSTGDYKDWGAGFHDCSLIGPGGYIGSGSVGTLFQVGDSTHASLGFQIDDDYISGFALALTWGNPSSWGTSCRESSFINNGQQLLYNLNSATGLENASFDHCVFGGDTFSTGMLANAIQLGTGTSTFDGNFVDCSFDGAQLVATNGSIKTVNAHHENPGGNTTNAYTVANGALMVEDNPDFYQDSSSGSVPSTFVSQTAGVYKSTGPYYYTNANMTNAVNNTGGGNMILMAVRQVHGTYSVVYNVTGDFAVIFDHLGNINFGGPSAVFNSPLTIQGSGSKLTMANLLLSSTAPTIASGFGTSPSIVQQNGTAAFTINVGTSNTGTGVVTMPTAAHGWSCTATDTTTTSTTVSQTKVVPTSVTSVTFQNYTDISGTHAWVDSDVLAVNCNAY